MEKPDLEMQEVIEFIDSFAAEKVHIAYISPAFYPIVYEAALAFCREKIQLTDNLLYAAKDFVQWCEEGALTGSDRAMFVKRFKSAIAKAQGQEEK